MGFWNWFGGRMDEEDDESTEPEAPDGPPDGDEPEAVDGGPGPDFVEVEHRVGELEEDLERNGGRIESVQHSQQEVTERLEEMDETVRDLLGVYERLTDDVNPFTDGTGDETGGFGVVNGNGEHADVAEADTDTEADDRARETDGDDVTPEDDGDDVTPEDTAAEADGDDATDGERVFTFEDAVAGVEREAESAEPAEPATEEPIEAAAPADDGTVVADDGGPTGRASEGGGPPGETPYLGTLADGYATDVLTLEWLAELVETTGPAATLKAISYYEDVGWIGPSVTAALEEYLAGPGIDVNVDPNEPMELCVEDHVTSYEYILKLDAIHELERTA